MAPHDPTADARLDALADRAELVTLLDRYARALDDRAFDAHSLAALFTPDATVGVPSQEHEGLTDLSQYLTDSLAAFGTTQHIYANHLIELRGDEASLRVNSNATYVLLDTERVYVAGAVVTGTAVRTPYGWRLKTLTLTPTWDTIAMSPAAEPSGSGGSVDASDLADDE
ncbi:nuclear transport factor 2 family protein [Actinomadura logoneensis]|uniref:Nuclear transport factor 2 family protein n=1 Tax=Actinomadura logoneensis TaxID=2293572 RepID=A0A372JUW6_9ACTN|nr:nuclear transport factor 2 family protein [Actinomadura logoneensis]RFU43596.1 nuclear transport factor 2 family protein [Actinomadura logoneensis]